MAQAISGEPSTAPLVVVCTTWGFAMRYATTPGHAAKPRVVREECPDGVRWAVFTRVPCGAVRAH